MEPDNSRKRWATASRTTTWTCRMDSHHRDHCPQEAAGHPTGAAGPGSSSYPAVDWAARSPPGARGCGTVHGRVHGSKRIPPARRPDPRGREAAVMAMLLQAVLLHPHVLTCRVRHRRTLLRRQPWGLQPAGQRPAGARLPRAATPASGPDPAQLRPGCCSVTNSQPAEASAASQPERQP